MTGVACEAVGARCGRRFIGGVRMVYDPKRKMKGLTSHEKIE
jgi:hypothetical protein